MGFTKLDSGIVDSSLWSEPPTVRVLWITLLAKCDSTGHVRAVRDAIKRAANIPDKEFEEAMICLESADPSSRSSEFDGRRIQKVEGGWLILNYLKYRELWHYSDNPEAIKKRRQRGRLGTCPDTKKNVPDIYASASYYASKGKGSGENQNGSYDALVKALTAIWPRPHGLTDYAEQSTVFELSKRPDILEEIKQIEKFHTQEKKFFPQSLSKLVSSWESCLDRARVWKPHRTPEQEREHQNFLKSL